MLFLFSGEEEEDVEYRGGKEGKARNGQKGQILPLNEESCPVWGL